MRINILKGFTLIELLATVTIAAILMAVAVPSFKETVRSNRLTTQTNELISALNLARSEAVKRGQQVVVRRAETGWRDGWQVFVDISRSGANANAFDDATPATVCATGEDCVLKVYPALPDIYTLTGFGNLSDFIRYTPAGISNYVPDGQSNILNDYFVICDNSDGNATPEAYTARLISLNTAGRARLAEDTDSPKDGIPDKEDGNNITSCN